MTTPEADLGVLPEEYLEAKDKRHFLCQSFTIFFKIHISSMKQASLGTYIVFGIFPKRSMARAISYASEDMSYLFMT